MKRSREETALRFNEMADTYDDSADTWLKRTQAKVLQMAQPASEDIVLDIGTGTGAIAIGLARHVREVLALDISSRMLEKAAQKLSILGLRNVALNEGSFDDLPQRASRLKGKTSLITTCYAMHHLDSEEKARALQEMHKLLAPGGKIVIGDLMFFEDPAPHRDLYDPEVDDPAPVSELEDHIKRLGMKLTTVRLHPIVGALRGE